MRHATRSSRFAVGPLAVAFAALTAGCGNLLPNLIEERSGDVSVIVVNNTPYRASFTLGSYNAFALDPPGFAAVEQQRLEANSSTEPLSLICNRTTAIGTEALFQRVIDTGAEEEPGFDADAFAAVVNFSSAPADSDAAALPTVGTAQGLEVRLGVDYACNDQLIFTLVEDSTATGGFRIEYRLLQTEADE